MYVKRSFALDEAEALELVASVGAADLVTRTADGGLDCTMLPFIWDPQRRTLLTHMARVNPQWRTLEEGAEVLVVAHGVDHHVTSDWLPAGDKVPTWNYEEVHLWGRLVVREDADAVRDVVIRTTREHEPTWRYEQDAESLEPQLRALVALEVEVTRIVGKAKLSQNKSPEVLASIVAGLEAKGLTEDAAAVRERAVPVATARQALVDAARASHQPRA